MLCVERRAIRLCCALRVVRGVFGVCCVICGGVVCVVLSFVMCCVLWGVSCVVVCGVFCVMCVVCAFYAWAGRAVCSALCCVPRCVVSRVLFVEYCALCAMLRDAMCHVHHVSCRLFHAPRVVCSTPFSY